MNKTLLTVAQVFAIISGIFFIFPLGMFIFPLILAFFNFKAASVFDKAKRGEATKEQVTNYSIYLIFTSLVGGICGLVAASSTNGDVPVVGSLEQRLKDLDNLFDRGIISREEYEARRKVIIDSI
ncbi:MAG: SHOCT domain-containing protein [Acholeplasma sp.]